MKTFFYLRVPLTLVVLAVLWTNQGYAQTSLTINQGADITKSNKVEVEVSASGATEMMLSEDIDFTGASWQPFQSKLLFELENVDGEHYIFFKARYPNQEESTPIAKKIYLDTQPPTEGYLNLTSGNYVSVPEGLPMEAIVKDADMMMISNYPDFRNARWREYRRFFTWNVPPGEGKKRIYAKFKDKAGNESEIVEETITLDATPPKDGSIEIYLPNPMRDPFTGSKITREAEAFVDLDLRASEAKYMMLSNTYSFFGERWQLFKEERPAWELPSKKDGTYRVYVKFMDIAQNESRIYADTLIIDTRPPYNQRFRINGGADLTDSPEVTLQLYAVDAHQMMVSDNPAFAGAEWLPYSIKHSFKLPEEDGVHTVYVAFRDFVGNVTKPLQDSIRLDRTAPASLSIKILEEETHTLSDRVKVRVAAEDATQMQISTSPNFGDVFWRRYSTAPQEVVLGSKRGVRTVYARFRDDAGNISTTVSDSIIVANKPVLCTINIENNQKYCTNPERKVTLILSARNADEMQISHSPTFDGASWEKLNRTKEWKLEGEDGEKRIFARFRNEFGVEGEVAETRVILDRTQPSGTFEVNNGEFITLQSFIPVSFQSENATSMKIGMDKELKDAQWMFYRENYTFNLGATKGERVIYAQLRDEAGNTSEIYTDTVSYAILTARNELVIDEGNPYTTDSSRMVQLKLFSSNAIAMQISNSPTFDGASWESFSKIKNWQLTEGDGEKVVYARFKSETETVSEVVAKSIILDTEKPIGTLKMADGNRTKVSKVQVNLTAEKAQYMQVSAHPEFKGAAWRYIEPTAYFNLGSQRGKTHYFYARFRDEAGNISNTVSDSVIFEITPYRNALVLDGGELFTNDSEGSVQVTLNSQGARFMQLSEDSTFASAEWQAYEPQTNFRFSGEDGVKTLFARFRSETETVSEVVWAKIALDREKPDGRIEVNNGEWQTLQPLVDVSLYAEGADFMRIGLSEDLKNIPWMSYKESITINLGVTRGTRTIYAEFKDEAGNISTKLFDSVSYAILPVRNSVEIDGGKAATNAKDAKVSLQLRSRNATQMIVSNDADFQGASWEPFNSEKQWQLPDSDGRHVVYAKFKSITETESEIVTDTIILDRLAPVGNVTLKLREESERDPVLDIYPESATATTMQIASTDNFQGLYWEAYREGPIPIRYTSRGEKRIFMRFRDEAGNESEVVSDTIILAIYPFAAEFTIDNGKQYCTDPDKKVTLSIFCRAAEEMMVSNLASFEGATWEKFSISKEWILAGEDGKKAVFMKFRSETGHESELLQQNIELDRSPPQNAQIVLNNGEETTLNAYAEVAVKADDARSMRISVDSTFRGASWRSYSEYPFRIDLPSQGGWHAVYAQFQDQNGNTSPIVSDKIMLLIVPLETRFTIEHGAIYCNRTDRNVTLNLFARDATEMMISNRADFSGSRWQPYKSQSSWQLSPGDGEKEVYVKFRSRTETESSPLLQKIVLDTQPPVNCDITVEQDLNVASYKAKITAKATDAIQMQIMEGKESSNNASVAKQLDAQRWVSYTDTPQYFTLSPGEGTKVLFARFRDEAGNISRIIRKTYRVDTTPPQEAILQVNDGNSPINQREVTLTLQLKPNEDPPEFMRISHKKEGFTESLEWVPYSVKTPWELADYDGTHHVFAQLKDTRGNVTSLIQASVDLDREPPLNPRFEIQGDHYCRDPKKQITLELYVDHAASMWISNEADFSDGGWEYIKPLKRWTLAGEDGFKNVYVKFKDYAGNETPTLSHTVLLDRQYPEGTIEINEGATLTNNPVVQLQLDVPEAHKMLLSGNSSFRGVQWKPFSPTDSVTVAASNGEKVVYARFMDEVGNISPIMTDTIVLDMQPPVTKSIQVNVPPTEGQDNLTQLENPAVELFIDAKDAAFVRFANSEESIQLTEWKPYMPTPGESYMQVAWELTPVDLTAASEGRNPAWKDGQVGIQGEEKIIYYQLKDIAGNESAVLQKKVMLYAPKPMEVFIWKWQ